MTDKWIKIDNDYFEAESIEVQLSIGAHGTLHVLFDINKTPSCYQYLTSWFDMSINSPKSSYVRKISCKSFDAIGCFIKTFDFNPVKNNIYVEFNCDYLELANVSLRRDDKINELLNKGI